MNIPNTDSWFYLEPYVYTEQKPDKILLYNTLDASSIEIYDPIIYELVNDIFNNENLGVSLIKAEQITKQPYLDFITDVRQKYMGDIIPLSSSEEKPIQLYPILNLQKGIERLQKQNENALGQNVLDYLTELTIYINSACDQNCCNCSWYAKQTKCCSKYLSDNQQEELPLSTIKELLDTYPRGRVNITGGNIFLHSKWDSLKSIFENYQSSVFFWLHYLNLSQAERLPKNSVICLFLTFPIDKASLKEALEKIQHQRILPHFLITNEAEYEQAEELAEKLKLSNYNIVPIYNSENHAFFKEHVFIDREDIFSSPLSLKRIFSQQAVNAKFFGNFYILPNQDVKANLNTKTVGNLKETPFIKLIQKELIDNTAWRSVRNHQPCSDCLYQYLCPPPSNYEYVMKRSNMCKIA